MGHASDKSKKISRSPLLGSRTYADDIDAQFRSGSPSRKRRTRCKAWAQSQGSELVSDSRVAEGESNKGETTTTVHSGQTGVAQNILAR